MIYGYCGDQVNDYGLFEMKEITFSMSPEALRGVALFLKDMADRIDGGEFESCSHRHIESSIPNWADLCSGSDIIVMPPEV